MTVTARWKADTMSGIMLILDQHTYNPLLSEKVIVNNLAGWLRQRANGIGLLCRMWQPMPGQPLTVQWDKA